MTKEEEVEKTKQKIRELLNRKCQKQSKNFSQLDLSTKKRNEAVYKYFLENTKDEEGRVSRYLGSKKYLKLTEEQKDLFYKKILNNNLKNK